MRLVVEEISDFLVEGDKAVTGIERWDVVGGVGRGGSGHCFLGCSDVLKADC